MRSALVVCVVLFLGVPESWAGGRCPQGKVLWSLSTQGRGGLWFKRATQKLDRIANALKQRGIQVRIEGHTNSRGSGAFNRRRSLMKALRVRKALIQRGVPARHLQAVGLGEDCPIASNRTRAGRLKNSRIQLVAIGGGGPQPRGALAPRRPRLPLLFFAVGKVRVTGAHQKLLEPVVRYLLRHKKARLSIEAHGAVRPRADLRLLKQRAKEVAMYLRQQGIPPRRLVRKNFGPTRPIASNRTSAGRAKNRRVSLRWLP